MDPFEEFEFKPLTEGLGFHKKAEKLKHDIIASNLSEERVGRTVPDVPPADLLNPTPGGRKPISILDDDDDDTGAIGPRAASKSISELIAALPPSLDFLDEAGTSKTASSTDDEDDGISSYPFLKKRKRTNESKASSQGTPAIGSSNSASTTSLGQQPSASRSTPKTLAADAANAANSLNETPSLLSLEKDSKRDAVDDDGSRPQIFKPLGRAEYNSPQDKTATEKAPLKTSTAMPSLPKPGSPAVAASTASGTSVANKSAVKSSASSAPPQNPKLEESYARAFPHADKSKHVEKTQEKAVEKARVAVEASPLETPDTGLRKVSTGIAPALLDCMAVLGVSTIFLVIIIVITQIDLVRMLSHAKTNSATHFYLTLLFLCVMHLYVLTARAFFGATLGEWAFEMQLGTEDEQRTPKYLLRLIWRMMLVFFTGIVTLPLLSKVFGSDLAAKLGAPQLYKRPQ